ncbi:MAG: hypothetical protein IJ559_08555 [Prevotella sp.]|nr:hypothetical protein [Prevotella sp.]
MKISKLLVLSALWLFGLNANAVDGNVWTKPAFPAVPEVSEFTTYQEGVDIYLYNVATHLFYTNGNNWATRASLIFATGGDGNGATAGEAVKGIKVQITRTDAAIEKGDGVVEIKGDVKGAGNYLSCFAGGWNDVWTDNNGRADRFWKFTANGDSWRISNVVNETDKFLGWNGSDTRLYLLAADAEGVGIDWKIVSEEAYAAWEASIDESVLPAIKEYGTALTVYETAMSLKEVLDEAEKIGATVTDQIAVYNNTASTKADLDAAITAAQEAIAAREKELAEQNMDNASVENPIDVTSFIANASYDTSKSTGWSGSVPSGYSYTAPEQYEGSYTAANPFDQYQDVTGLKDGVYAVGVQGYAREGSTQQAYQQWVNGTKNEATLYATSGGETLSVPLMNIFEGSTSEKFGVGTEYGPSGTADAGQSNYVPNNMQAAATYFDNGRYKNELFTEATGGSIRIGLKQPSVVGMRWTMWDNWTLVFYGKGADAYQLWNDKALASYVMTPGEGVLFTQKYVDDINAAVTGKTASNKADVLANIAAAATALEAYNENLTLWNQWSTQVDEAMKTYKANSDAPIDEEIKLALLDYIESEEGFTCRADELKAALNLDNDGLKAEMEKLKKLVDDFEDAVKNQVKPGDDVTNLLKNPNFDDGQGAEYGWTGWHNTTNSMPTTGGTADNKTAEAWSAKSFDLYQEIENAPVGIYEISVQGFYRYGRDDAAWNHYQSQDVEYVKKESAPVYVYLNDKRTPFKNIYDEESQSMDFYVTMAEVDEEGTPKIDGATNVYAWKDIPYSVQNVTQAAPEKFYPNGMASAALCFSAGLYTQKATSLVAKKGDALRLGVKGSTQQPDQSDCWVIWDNFKLTYKGKATEDVQPVLEEAITDAQKMLIDPETQETKPIGKDAYEILMNAISEAQAALNSGDGTLMFDKLAALVSINVDASAAKFDSLKTAYTAFESAIEEARYADADTKPADATIAEAWSLQEEIQNGMLNRTLTDADADRLMEEMAVMTKKLHIPAAMATATDANPTNATKIITNPDYDSANNNGWTISGATPGFGSGLIEVFNTNFDEYQDLELPEGTYEVSVQGFYRFGDGLRDDSTYVQAPTENNNLLLYVTVGENTVSVPMPRLAQDGKEEHTSFTKTDDGKAFVAGDDLETADRWQWMWIGTPEADADSLSATGIRMANGLVTASTLFENGKFTGTSIIFKVGADGKARIGLKKEVQEANNWCLWDNWTLTYYGANSTKEPTGIVSTVASAAKTEFFGLNGARINKPTKGVAIMRQTLSDGTVKTTKVIIK